MFRLASDFLAIRIMVLIEQHTKKEGLKSLLTTATMQIQSSGLNGCRNTNMLTSAAGGFFMIKLIVKSMKGLVKSMAFSRSAVMVKDPIAISAF